MILLFPASLSEMTPFSMIPISRLFPRLFAAAVLVSLVSLTGCDALDGTEADSAVPSAEAIIVANGGNFSDQNGSLTFFDPETGTVTQSSSRAGFVQGVLATPTGLAILINTFDEGRIDVLDPVDGVLLAQYTGMDNPRDAHVHDDTLWVTTSTFGEIGHALALGPAGQVHSATPVGFVPEGILSWAGRTVVANNGSLGSGTTLSLVASDGQEAEEIEAGCDGPRDLYAASALMVVCSGKTVYTPDFSAVVETTPGQVVFINDQFDIEHTLTLPGQAGSTNGTETAYYAEATGELFIILSASEQVVVIDAATRSIARTYDLSGHPTLVGLSGIAYDAGRGMLYVGRFPQSSAGPFPDYAAAGTVQVLDTSGEQIDAFPAGIAISSIILQ